MKKLLIVFLTVFSVQAFATSESVFDQPELGQDFKKLDKIESLVAAQPDLTFDTLKADFPELSSGLSSETGINQTAGNMPLVGPFWWGCILGIVGLLLVYIITDNDKAQLKSALIGCVVGTLIWGTAWALSGSFLWW